MCSRLGVMRMDELALLVCAVSREVRRSIASLVSESERRAQANVLFGELGQDVFVERGVVRTDDAKVFLLDDSVAGGVLILGEHVHQWFI